MDSIQLSLLVEVALVVGDVYFIFQEVRQVDGPFASSSLFLSSFLQHFRSFIQRTSVAYGYRIPFIVLTFANIVILVCVAVLSVFLPSPFLTTFPDRR